MVFNIYIFFFYIYQFIKKNKNTLLAIRKNFIILYSFFSIIFLLNCDWNNFYNNTHYLKFIAISISTFLITNTLQASKNIFISLLYPSTLITIFFLLSNSSYTYYDDLNLRFGIPIIGSSNSTAYFFSYIILIGIYQIYTTRKSIYLQLICVFLLLISLILTQSRGGIILLFIGLLFLFKNNKKILYFLIFLIPIFFLIINIFIPDRYNLISAIFDGHASGRFSIWIGYYNWFVENFSISKLLFGYGSNIIYVEYDRVDHITYLSHSSIIEIFTSFGLCGLIFFLIILKKIFNNINTIETNTIYKSFFIIFLVSLFIDGYLFNTNLLIFHSVLFSFLLKK